MNESEEQYPWQQGINGHRAHEPGGGHVDLNNLDEIRSETNEVL